MENTNELELMVEETEVEQDNEVTVYDLEPIEEDEESGHGGLLTVVGILGAVGAAGVVAWKATKKKRAEIKEKLAEKRDLRDAERLRKRGADVFLPSESGPTMEYFTTESKEESDEFFDEEE